MIPPGLLCGHCEQPLYPHTARLTDYGWMHSGRCPNRADQQRAAREQARAERIEDLTFMAEMGESLAGAAERIGTTISALEHFLTRANRRDLLTTLTARNPRDHNARANREAVVRARRMRDDGRVAA